MGPRARLGCMWGCVSLWDLQAGAVSTARGRTVLEITASSRAAGRDQQ